MDKRIFVDPPDGQPPRRRVQAGPPAPEPCSRETAVLVMSMIYRAEMDLLLEALWHLKGAGQVLPPSYSSQAITILWETPLQSALTEVIGLRERNLARKIHVGKIRQEKEGRVSACLPLHKGALPDDVLKQLYRLPRPWSPEFGRIYISSLGDCMCHARDGKLVDKKPVNIRPWIETLPVAAQAIPEACFDDMMNLRHIHIHRHSRYCVERRLWHRTIDGVAATIRRRKRLAEIR